MQIDLVINAEPVAQGRPRFSRRGSYVSTYDPPKSKQYKALCQQQLQQQYSKKQLEMPIGIDVKFYRSIQKATSKKDRELKLRGVIRPVVKPDVDNFYKAVTDAMTGIIYHDDNQIVEVNMAKYYGNKPRTEIKIYTI